MTWLPAFRPLASACTLLGLGVALCIASVSVVLSGCGSSAPASSPVQEVNGETPSAARLASSLRAETRRWAGTPYRLGGTTRRGVDCSGFMQNLYRDVLGVKLPRSTRTQVRTGRRIGKDELRPGDLVFFRPTRKVRHVGVYVGEGEFAHASSSRGPTISPLGREYWQEAYWTARRVVRLTPDTASADTRGVAAQALPARTSERTGW